MGRNFTLLADAPLQASGGRLDLFADPLIEEVAKFGPAWRLSGVYRRLPIARSAAGGRALMPSEPRFRLGCAMVNRRGWGCRRAAGRLFALGWMGSRIRPRGSGGRRRPGTRAARWFYEAGIMNCRPDDPTRGMGAALKAGSTPRSQSQRRRSYVVAWPAAPLPIRAEKLHARTFSGKRYESKCLTRLATRCRESPSLYKRGGATRPPRSVSRVTDRSG